MIGPLAQLNAQAASGRGSPVDVEARLVAPLFAHTGSLMVAHIAGLLLTAAAMAWIGGPWPDVLMAAGMAVLTLRILVLYRVGRLHVAPTPQLLLRWRLPYQLIGLAWCTVSALLCTFCILAGDEPVRLLSICLLLGTAAGIASRSASTPRFALIQIVLWLLPLAALVPRFGWAVLLLGPIYFAALLSIVRRHYTDIVAMIDAQQTSQRIQDALSEREAALRAIFDTAAAGVTEIDVPTRRFVRVNQVFCDMLGRSETELLGDFDPTSIIHPDDKSAQSDQWAAIRSSGRSFEAERRFSRVDGTVVWGHVSVSASALDGEGRTLRVVSIIQDITERKLAEAALRASQDLLVLSLDIGGVGTFRRDYREGLIHCGRETRLMSGLPLTDAPIPAALWLETVLPDDRPRLMKKAADAHALRSAIVSLDYRFLHPDHGIRYAETRSRVEYDPSGCAISSVGVVIDVTDHRRAESRLVHLAHHDPLTDLPNRSLFRIRLDMALEPARHGEPFAILCLDLDHFKDVNDTHGHPVGDSLLQAVTQRLLSECRSTDTVARLGGDEFAIILAPIRQAGDAAAFSERIVAALSAPYNIEGHRIVIGTSVGIAIAPDDGLDPDRLMRNADMALFGAKGGGRGRSCIFEPSMTEKVRAHRALDIDLRQALADGALELFYQPQIGIETHCIRGFEALIRWRHPERGLILPDTFIPLAESNGLIVPIGAFVVHQACAQAVLWPNGANVAVNLSASEFTSPHLLDTIAGALRQSGLDPIRLELEITETTMLQDTAATIEILHKLKALGVRLSIDDFGTGFSSLAYLQRFPFDKVKIDRSFITPLGQTRESLAIVGAVTGLCADLDMETTAEGVETESQLAILASLGCTEAQGYYFSRPRPIGELQDLITGRDLVPPQRYPGLAIPSLGERRARQRPPRAANR